MKLKTFFISMLILISAILFVSANPVLDTIVDQEVNETDTVSFDITNTIPDNGNSTFNFSPSLSWISLTPINNTAATITLSPDFDDSGIYNVEFSVSDDNSTHTDNATITVHNVNRAPTIDLPDSEILVLGFPETVSFTASDADGDNLTYSVFHNTSEVTCGVANTNLTMTPATDFTGTASCTVQANDSSLTADDTIIITVEAQNPSVSISEVDLGDIELNTTTDTKSFTITNNGNIDLSGISMNWSSTYDKYNITFTDVASTLAVGISDTADVTIFIPEDESTGSLTIPITFMSDELNKTNAFNLKANVQGRLRITDLDVKVDDKTDSNIEDKEDDYKINEKAEPESHITFSVRVENAFPDDSLEIQDITVRITIEEIDEDGDDLEEESDEFDLDADKDKKVSLDFDVPLKVDEDDYNVIIEIEGEDEDGNEHEVTKILILEVDKESHNLKIKKTSLNPDIVSCDREAELDVTVINIGSRTEEEVVITVKSSALGINLAERDIEVGEDPEDDDNEYEKTFKINIADTVKAGTYTIETRTYYDEDKLEDLKRDTLQVKDCKEATPEKKGEEEEVEVITPPEEGEEEVTPPVEEKKKFTETTEYVLLLILVNIIVIGGVVSLLIPSLRR